MACMIIVVSWIVLNTLLNIFVTERSSSYQSTAHARWPRANLEEPANSWWLFFAMGSEECCVPCSSGWFYVLLMLAAIGLFVVVINLADFLFCSVCCCRYYWCGAWRVLVNLQQQPPTRLGRSVDLALLRSSPGGTTQPSQEEPSQEEQ